MSDGFLSRWARRKEAVRATERTVAPAHPDADEAEVNLDTEAHTGEGSPAPQPVVLTGDEPEAGPDDLLARLPSLDALTPETDLTAFLQAGVPTALRNAALRRMWSLDPAIRDFVSEAREYAYDWNTPGGVPGMGPLLPTDDVKAMLKRIVDGVPVAAEEEPAPESQEAPTASSEDAAESADTALPEPETDPATASLPMPMPDMHAPVAVAAVDAPEVEQPTLPRPRLRRHGGAMPS
ncbi:hypothetical protein ASF53_19855 [Methylobacterium sp. Leaf123]|uniref:DUF3306 domain-containing protein n=1 Tax=Methylobacterium sp. Leaf123 TaxID=1736264 RepID=UPI0006FF3E20|nr:DUF3306 domain-containing protein [Methylobacterium sp. Leaf123]KQQ27154.1 hypothetical protein ASF53_19855 [Methylobacterium sp. Leaf123]